MEIVGLEGIKATYVGHYGGDIDIVRAARVSTGKETFELGEKEGKLIQYMAKNNHTTPFEMIDIKMLIDCPIFIARQFHRHRTFSYNEWSGRYSVVGSSFYIRDKFNKQDSVNKQSSSGEFTDAENCDLKEMMEYITHKQFEIYDKFIEREVSKEQARIILGQNMMTRFYAKNDLHNWMHYLKQRCDPHAQEEHQYLAKQVFKTLFTMFPISVAALAKKRFSPEALTAVGLKELIEVKA